ncbi:hypothetical protein [Streptomyces nigrescens]|uniref:hypothetical protein n=1 Tax=Streptomyces nigrescens TaxID=1920 RepID=UPI00348A01FF
MSEEFGQAVASGGQDDAVVGLEDVAGAEVPHEAGAWAFGFVGARGGEAGRRSPGVRAAIQAVDVEGASDSASVELWAVIAKRYTPDESERLLGWRMPDGSISRPKHRRESLVD